MIATASSFCLPDAIETYAICSDCSYSLSGEEIYSSWLHNNHHSTECPVCHAMVVQTSLLLYMPTANASVPSAPVLVELVKPVRLAALITLLQHKQLQKAAAASSSGAGAAASSIGQTHELAAGLRSQPYLFWNLFWYFISRGTNHGMSLSIYDDLFAHILMLCVVVMCGDSPLARSIRSIAVRIFIRFMDGISDIGR